MYNKLRLQAAILASESLTSSYPRANPLKSNRSVLNVNNGGPREILNLHWKKTAFG